MKKLEKVKSEIVKLISEVSVNGIASREDMVDRMPSILKEAGSKTKFPSYYMDTTLREMRREGLVEILNSVGMRGKYKLSK